MCNCITDISKKALEQLQKTAKSKNVSVVISEDGGLDCAFYLKGGEITYTPYRYISKTAGAEMGRKKVINIYHTFCPFCGKPYPKK